MSIGNRQQGKADTQDGRGSMEFGNPEPRMRGRLSDSVKITPGEDTQDFCVGELR